jgi:hypothetical protein
MAVGKPARPGAAVGFHIIFVVAFSQAVVTGVVALVRRRQWFQLVRHIYDQEAARNSPVDAVAFLATAKEGERPIRLR